MKRKCAKWNLHAVKRCVKQYIRQPSVLFYWTYIRFTNIWKYKIHGIDMFASSFIVELGFADVDHVRNEKIWDETRCNVVRYLPLGVRPPFGRVHLLCHLTMCESSNLCNENWTKGSLIWSHGIIIPTIRF
jgi:hypothetical protein